MGLGGPRRPQGHPSGLESRRPGVRTIQFRSFSFPERKGTSEPTSGKFQFPAPPLPCSVTLNKSLNLLCLSFLNRNMNTTAVPSPGSSVRTGPGHSGGEGGLSEQNKVNGRGTGQRGVGAGAGRWTRTGRSPVGGQTRRWAQTSRKSSSSWERIRGDAVRKTKPQTR